jgi:CRISPR-associated endonuclease/helicase Cas3
VVELSSMRSLIQLAGRILLASRWHRKVPESACVRHQPAPYFSHPQPAFCKPGFESPEFPLQPHFLNELLPMTKTASSTLSTRIARQARCSRAAG